MVERKNFPSKNWAVRASLRRAPLFCSQRLVQALLSVEQLERSKMHFCTAFVGPVSYIGSPALNGERQHMWNVLGHGGANQERATFALEIV